jgi:hypothetical protein
MLKYLVIIGAGTLALTGCTEAKGNTKAKVVYLVKGKEVSGKEAILSAIEGNEVYKCNQVESVMNQRTGSIRLRTLKIK